MTRSPIERKNQFREMRDSARQIFQHALAEASIDRAFQRHVSCDRGVLRVREDLYDLHSYTRVFVVSMGKAGHTMAQALEGQTGKSLEGIVASPVDPAALVRGFRYFRGGHPTPNVASIRAELTILKSLAAPKTSSLVISLVSVWVASTM